MKINSLLLLSIMALVPILDVVASYGGKAVARRSSSSGRQTSRATSGSGYSSGSLGASKASGRYSGQTAGTTSGSTYGSGNLGASKASGSYSGQTAGTTSGSSYASGNLGASKASGSYSGQTAGTTSGSSYASGNLGASKASGSYSGQTAGTTSGSTYGSGNLGASKASGSYSGQTAGTTSGSSYASGNLGASKATGSYSGQTSGTTGGSSYGTANQGVSTGGHQQRVQQVNTGYQQRTVQSGRNFSGYHDGYGRRGEIVGGGYRSIGGYQGGAGYVGAGLIGAQLATTQVEATPVVYGATETYAPAVVGAVQSYSPAIVQTYAPAVERAVETYTPVVARTIENVAQAETYAPIVTGIRTVMAKNILIRGKAERGFTPFRLCALQQEFYNRSFLGHTWEWWFDNYFPFFIGVFPFLFYAEYKVNAPVYFDYFNVFGAYPRPIENFDQFVSGALPWPTVEEVAAPLTTSQVVRHVQTVPVQVASSTAVPHSVYSGGFFRS